MLFTLSTIKYIMLELALVCKYLTEVLAVFAVCEASRDIPPIEAHELLVHG